MMHRRLRRHRLIAYWIVAPMIRVCEAKRNPIEPTGQVCLCATWGLVCRLALHQEEGSARSGACDLRSLMKAARSRCQWSRTAVQTATRSKALHHQGRDLAGEGCLRRRGYRSRLRRIRLALTRPAGGAFAAGASSRSWPLPVAAARGLLGRTRRAGQEEPARIVGPVGSWLG